MSPDKIARLEAIRAAKRGGATMPGESEIVVPGQNAAGESGLHVAESQAGLAPSPATTPAPNTGPVAAVGQSMSDDKKARLEAIRAAKRAQQGDG
jgi:hypothetical protein